MHAINITAHFTPPENANLRSLVSTFILKSCRLHRAYHIKLRIEFLKPALAFAQVITYDSPPTPQESKMAAKKSKRAVMKKSGGKTGMKKAGKTKNQNKLSKSGAASGDSQKKKGGRAAAAAGRSVQKKGKKKGSKKK